MSDRGEKIRQVVEEARRRRSDGEVVSDQSITSSHPQLMPELESELQKLAVIEAARDVARLESDSTITSFEAASTTTPLDLEDLLTTSAIEIPDYELLACVGRGGFGAVWVARHRLHGEFCAVKVVARHRDIELDGVRTYRQRAKDHPGLVPIEHVGETDQCFYYIMPLADDVKGSTAIRGPEDYEPKTLKWCLNNLPPPPIEDVIAQGVELLDSIAILHRAGLAHQDIKPANVMMFGGHWKLGDLGLLTRNDQLSGDRGTIAFWPPEGSHSPTSDLYALGKTLFLLATGQQLDRFGQFLDTGFRIPGDRNLLERLHLVISCACHHDAEQRYRSAEDMRAALLGETFVSGTSQPRQRQPREAVAGGTEPPRAKTNRTVGGLLALVAAVVVIGVLVMSRDWLAGPPDVSGDGKDGGATVGGGRDDQWGPGNRGGAVRPGFEVSGSLAIARRDPQSGARPLSRVMVGDHLRIEVEHRHPAATFVLLLRTNGKVELLHPTGGPAVVAVPIDRVVHDIEVMPEDLSSQPGQLSGIVVIVSEAVSFAEWLDNLNVLKETPNASLKWNSPVSDLGWKYDSTQSGSMKLLLLTMDAAPGPGRPPAEIDQRSRKAGQDLRDFCEHLKSAPNSINVGAIVFPVLNPKS